MQFINGNWVQGKDLELRSCNPANNEVIWAGKGADSAQADAAIEAAATAQRAWSQLDPETRGKYLQRFVELLKDEGESIAEAISKELGKPLWESKTEVAAMIGKLPPTLEAFKERAIQSQHQRASAGGAVVHTRFRPHGVVVVLGPYNFPGHMPNGHIMPALLAGNTVVFKPSEKAPLVAQLTVELWQRAGVPNGVLNLLQGGGQLGAYLVHHPRIQAIFFTGSRRVGQMIQETVNKTGDKICALEMGGNSPLIVWDYSDIDAAVVATIQSSFITTGQRCSAARRLIVKADSSGELFLDKLVSVTNGLKIAPPTDRPEPYMGPLRNSTMVSKVLNKQTELISQGGKALLLARQLEVGPAFITPGIIDVTSVTERDDEEIFGPFLQLIRVEDFNAAITEANNTRFGLAAGLISENRSLYELFQKDIRAGVINWNQQLTGASPWAPFGGIKDSGNFHPSGYLAVDYCIYSTGSIEAERVSLPTELPAGLTL